MALAGLWENGRSSAGEWMRSFAIVTTASNEDRAKFSGRNIDPIAMMAAVPNLLDQLRAHFDWLDQTLADGRSFLQGPAAGLADLAAYHPVWFLRQNFGSAAAPLDGFPRLL